MSKDPITWLYDIGYSGGQRLVAFAFTRIEKSQFFDRVGLDMTQRLKTITNPTGILSNEATVNKIMRSPSLLAREFLKSTVRVATGRDQQNTL